MTGSRWRTVHARLQLLRPVQVINAFPPGCKDARHCGIGDADADADARTDCCSAWGRPGSSALCLSPVHAAPCAAAPMQEANVGSPLTVAEHIVGLADGAKVPCRVLCRIHVRVQLQREAAVAARRHQQGVRGGSAESAGPAIGMRILPGRSPPFALPLPLAEPRGRARVRNSGRRRAGRRHREQQRKAIPRK
jgi:hypothetical protein